MATTPRALRAMTWLTGLAALLWTTAIAGIWLLPHQAVTVATGLALFASFGALKLYSEHRMDERVRLAAAAIDERERLYLRTIGHLVGKPDTEPMRILRGVS